MNKRTFIVAAAVAAAGLLTPAAMADPVEVETGSRTVCAVYFGEDCMTPAVEVPTVGVRSDAAGQCIGIMVESCD